MTGASREIVCSPAFTNDIFQKSQFHNVALETSHVLDWENTTSKLKRSITFMKLNDMAPFFIFLFVLQHLHATVFTVLVMESSVVSKE